MHTFSYRALDSAGAMHAGELLTGSRASALETLSARGLIPVEVAVSGADASVRKSRLKIGSGASWRRQRRTTPRELLGLTQSLGALLSAGLTVERALEITTALAARPAVRLVSDALVQSVRSGRTLSESFGTSGQRLPPYYRTMVEAGEVGGSLPEAFKRLAELLGRQTEIRERLRTALVYPSILGLVLVMTLIVLLTFVLPRFESLFAESEAPLPWSTRAVLAGGRLIADYWWALVLAAAALVTGMRAWLRSATGRLHFDRWLLRTWLTFGLPVALDGARMLRTVATLCESGLPLPAALRVARGALSNGCLREALDAVTRDVQSGNGFAQSLARARVFPAIAVQLARVGEETGRLGELMLSAAKALEDESQNALERLLTLVVPLITIALGLIVAGLIGSVLVGLLSVNDLAF